MRQVITFNVQKISRTGERSLEIVFTASDGVATGEYFIEVYDVLKPYAISDSHIAAETHYHKLKMAMIHKVSYESKLTELVELLKGTPFEHEFSSPVKIINGGF